jgi:hypothetical protein
VETHPFLCITRVGILSHGGFMVDISDPDSTAPGIVVGNPDLPTANPQTESSSSAGKF